MSRKQILIAVCPLLLLALLVVPYSWFNQAFVVDWLGCGCPQIDEFGNLYEPAFNANDFTACFWLSIALIATVLAIFLAKCVFPTSLLLRILYIGTTAALSFFIAYQFFRYMMWN